jgi:hypothetical protein
MGRLAWVGVASAGLVCGTAEAQVSLSEYPRTASLTPASAADVLPAGFHGRIEYRGPYRGVNVRPTPPPNPMWRRGGPTGGPLPMGGEWEVVMTFDGARVSGTMEADNDLSGPHATPVKSSFTGTRAGAACEIQTDQGDRLTIYCGRSELRMNVNSVDTQGQTYAFATRAAAWSTNDFDQAGRQTAAAALPDDPARLPVADILHLPLSGQWNSRSYAVTVYTYGEWRTANPSYFDMSGMFDCRLTETGAEMGCQIDADHNRYKKPFIVFVTGGFKPKPSQMKTPNALDALMGAARYRSDSNPAQPDPHEVRCIQDPHRADC